MSPGQLSPRERQCVDLLSEGKSRPEIAKTLNIRVGTVDGYCYTICKKMGVSSTFQAVLRLRGFSKTIGGEHAAPPTTKDLDALMDDLTDCGSWREVAERLLAEYGEGEENGPQAACLLAEQAWTQRGKSGE